MVYRILAVDGGGVRGLLTARLLDRLDEEPSIDGWRKKVDSATGPYETRPFMAGTITLASAMAASGAPVKPEARASGQDPLRDSARSLLLHNLRLGYWARNPSCERAFPSAHARCPSTTCRTASRAAWRQKPKFVGMPGVPARLGLWFREDSAFLELTRGGHFDDTGIYELIRRRCACILAVDGSVDPNFEFAGLGNLIERVRIDFRAEIYVTGDALNVLCPAPRPGHTATCADQAWLKAGIGYDDDSQGTLNYLTPTLVAGLSADLYSYQRAHPSFGMNLPPTSSSTNRSPMLTASLASSWLNRYHKTTSSTVFGPTRETHRLRITLLGHRHEQHRPRS